jgi:hypothetical protein
LCVKRFNVCIDYGHVNLLRQYLRVAKNCQLLMIN